MLLYTFTLTLIVVGAFGTFPMELWGRSNPRIVGGTDTTITRHPHQVSLEEPYRSLKYEHTCGGSIINREWVVTAAHCVIDISIHELRIRVGTSIREYGGTLHNVSKIIVHRKFNNTMDENFKSSLHYDVAIIKVKKSFTFSQRVKPIKMRHTIPFPNSVVTATGWGTTAFQGQKADILQEVEIRVLDREKCAKRVDGITSSMLCAGVPNGGKDACQSDSGGPLVYVGRLAGIVSWGIGCAKPGYPGVYTDVAYVRKWIERKAGM